MQFYQNLFPFKPFKSKRGAHRAIDDVQTEITKTLQQQELIVAEWATITEIKALKLEIHKQGAPLLRWRFISKSDGKRKYVRLFHRDTSYLTDNLNDEAIEMLSVFEHHRILVNAKSKSLHSTLKSVEKALEELEQLPIIKAAV